MPKNFMFLSLAAQCPLSGREGIWDRVTNRVASTHFAGARQTCDDAIRDLLVRERAATIDAIHGPATRPSGATATADDITHRRDTARRAVLEPAHDADADTSTVGARGGVPCSNRLYYAMRTRTPATARCGHTSIRGRA